MTKNDVNIKEVMTFDFELPKSKFTGGLTYTTLFMTPAFGIRLDEVLYHYYINAYIDDFELMHKFDRPLFILIKVKNPETDINYKNIDNKFRFNKTFRYTYTVGRHSGYYMYMYVFECPKAFHNDYNKFIRGEYSQFSQVYKARFPKIIQDSRGDFDEHPVYAVTHKTEKMKRRVEDIIGEKLNKKQEYFGVPNTSMEVFRYKSNF